MNSRERVKRCLGFDHPDRVPRETWLLPIAIHEHGEDRVREFLRRWPSDIDRPAVPNERLAALVEGDPFAIGRYRDEWGCVFENVQAGIIGEVKTPQLRDWSRLDALRPPVEALMIDRDEVNRQCAASDKYMLGGCCPRPFERIQFLRGTEDVFMDVMCDPPEFRELLARVHAFYCDELVVWAQTDVDGLSIMDDWGMQDRLLISPDKWRELFRPLYADYVRIAHDAGKALFMHSDGHIAAIYEDLIELRIDAINSQLFCMDFDDFAPRCKGRITFWGEIDRQHILPAEDDQLSRDAVRQVVEHLWDPAGGVIAQFELGAGARLENAEAVYQTWSDLTAGHPPASE
jgi:hypothetical protein